MASKRVVFPAFLLLSLPALASDPHLIVTVGQCSRQVDPDRGLIVITADVLDPDAVKAVERATAAYEAAKSEIKHLALPALELTTVEYTLVKQLDWEKNRNVFKGYRARIGLRVATSDLKRLGEVIPAATRHGIKDVGQISSYLSDEATRREKNSCLKDAVENARGKAEKIAQGLNATLGQATLVAEVAAEAPAPRPLAMDRFAGGAANVAPPMNAPGIESGKQTVQTAVQASFEFSK